MPELQIDIYDWSAVEDPAQAGFYYNLPYNAETGEIDRSGDLFIVGPFPTPDAALAAGRAFVIDAFTDHTKDAA